MAVMQGPMKKHQIRLSEKLQNAVDRARIVQVDIRRLETVISSDLEQLVTRVRDHRASRFQFAHEETCEKNV